MQPCVPYRTSNQQLWLSPERCVFWEDQKTLIVSDAHFGKTGHFRKAGIAVPQAVFTEDLQRLISLLQYFQPAELIFVGDLFHSRENKELDFFQKWRENFTSLGIHLVRGNHDILEASWYTSAGIDLHEGVWERGPFRFIHDLDLIEDYVISGHIHPGIRISGLGKQSLSFPCFYFGREYAVLPAFSRFTGVALIEPRIGERVFAIMHSNNRIKPSGTILEIQ
jgi:uncharacterized protein